MVAKNKTFLSVFVGCASDTDEDVDAIRQAANEVNGHSDVVHFDVKHWRRDAISELGSTTPQNSIESQIFLEADVFIILLHARAGSLLPEGTTALERELQKAIDIASRDSKKLCQLYIKQKAYPRDIDLEQIKIVRRMEKFASDKGLYVGYNDQEHLQQHIRVSLSKFAGEYHKRQSSELGPAPEPSVAAPPVSNDFDEDYGVFEALDYAEEKMAKAVEYLHRNSSAQDAMSSKIEDLVNKYKYVGVSNLSKEEQFLYMDTAADAVKQYLDECAPELDSFDVNINSAMQASYSAFSDLMVHPDASSSESVQNVKLELGKTIGSMRYAVASVEKLKSTVSATPRYSRNMKREWRRLEAFLDRFVQVVEAAAYRGEQSLSLLG